MLGVCLLALFCLVTADTNYDRTDGSYFITHPRQVQRDVPFTVGIDILNTTAPVQVTAEIQRLWYNTSNTHMNTPYRIKVAEASGSFTKGKTGKLAIKTPSHLEDGSYVIHVRGSNGLQFEREQSISLHSKTTSIMVQTDKAMYKPGQKVNLRAFAVFPNLQVYTGKFDITIKDPNNNILKWWVAVDSDTGVVEREFQLADQPPLGDWTISVHSEEHSDHVMKTFTVAEYQLPRFEVKVELAQFALSTDQKIVGKVKATYTFGKPVKGMVELHAHLDTSNDFCGRPPKFVELAFPIDGETNFELPVSDLTRISGYPSGHTYVLEAIVKEQLTGARLNGSSKITFYNHPYKIDVLSSSPKTFSPRLPYRAYVMVTQQDGSPVTDVASPVRMFPCVRYSITQSDQEEFSCSSFTGTYGLPPSNYTIPSSGIIPIDLHIPDNTTQVDIVVHYKEIKHTHSITKKYSDSNNYMQVRLSNKGLRAGQTATFTVDHTEDLPYLSYEILSRGEVISTDRVSTQDQSAVSITVPVTTAMAPVSHIIAYYVRDSGEVVADSLAFSVDDFFDNKVSIAFSHNQSQPNENIDVLVTADPNSNVNLLAVDQSVLLLKSGNDITTDAVLDELKSYGSGSTAGDFSPEVFAISSSSTHSHNVFSDTGLDVMTDAKHYGSHSYFGGFTGTGTGTGTGIGTGMGSHMVPQAGVKEVERVRKLFPETWLWLNQTVGSDGKATINTTVPDTITSWVASAFAVNPTTGLGVAPTTAKLRVFRPFFVSVLMPTSVLRGEQVVIQASVFNYLNSDVDVVVSLPTSSSYANLVVDSAGKTTQESKDQRKYITVKSNEPGTVFFPIVPSALGVIDIEVSARSTLAADAVRRQIIVEPEGIPKEYNIPVFVDLTSGASDFNKKVSLNLPAEHVAGSEKVKVKVTGDLIGASLDSLEKLLALPTGCGEQSMMSFAPDVYVADYLTTTHQMTPALEAKIYDYLQLGFQRELTYQRTDGSFSPFGNRDGAGNMWLTAFVARTFHQAKPFMFVDNSTLARALNWMTKRQNLDGSFNEPGLVLNAQMQKSRASLTAQVLLAFLENSDMVGFGVGEYAYGNATQNATRYLESVASTLTDPFDLAVVSYALYEASSSVADIVFTKLDAAATTKGTIKYWTEPATESPAYYAKWSPPSVHAQPIDIQTTAYALLASSASGDIKGGQPIVNWLTAQRNPHGGFSSTQDTMIALMALTDYARRTHTTGFNVNLDLTAGSAHQKVTVNDQNALVLQSSTLPSFPSEASITATGKGVAYAEIDVFFNVKSEIGDPAFDINTVLLDDTVKNFRLMTCTKWLKKGKSGMAVMEISIPTGFEPDVTSIGNVADIKRVERRGRNVVVYFDQIGKTSICFDMLSTRTGMVTNNQQSHITVYDYYQPDNQASVFYIPRRVKSATICDVCHKCCPHA